jgi:hypothetical protein
VAGYHALSQLYLALKNSTFQFLYGIDVRKGPADGDLIQVIGPLKPGDQIVKRATDEVREGTIVRASSK